MANVLFAVLNVLFFAFNVLFFESAADMHRSV